MSRSKRKRSFCGIYGLFDSEQDFKRVWHRRMRAMIRQRLLEPDFDAILLPLDIEAGEIYCSIREGKKWFDAREHPEWMRK